MRGIVAPTTLNVDSLTHEARARTTLALRFATLGISLAFASLVTAYLVARLGRNPFVSSGVALPHLVMPIWFWFSTLVVMVSSLSLWGAGQFAELDNPRLARRAYLAATVLGYVFLLLQIPGVTELYLRHRGQMPHHVGVYGLVFLLFGLHGLHVLGGLPLLTRRALSLSARPLDRAHRAELAPISFYWHFLAILWIVLWNLLLLVG